MNSIADDVRIGLLEPTVVSNALKKGTQAEADEAWLSLQHILVEAGISAALADQNRDPIILNLRGIVEKDDLLRATEKAAPTEIPEKIPEATEPAAEPSCRRSLNDMDHDDLLADEPSGLPFLPLPPIGFSYSPSYSNQTRSSFIREQPIPIEEFPIPVAMENDPVDTSKCLQKECLPLEDFPIPVTKEFLISDRNAPDANLPIPVIVTSTKPKHDLDPAVFKAAIRTKKTNRLSRLRWQITSSKETFINHIKQGQNTNVQLLLSRGADVNVQNELGQTALMVAASFGHEHITRTLLEYGAEIHASCQAGQTALNVAAIRGHERVVRMLVASGARVNEGKDIGKLALAQAAAYGQDRIVQFLLDSGADVDAFGGNDETALGMAAVNGNMKVARMLLDHGARVNHERSHWQLPLHKAVKANCVEMARLLVQRGADPMLKKGKFDTSLDYAKKMHRTEILRVFADYGFRPVSTAPYQYF